MSDFSVNKQPKLQKMYNYYNGNHSILTKSYADASKPCARIVTNFCKTIVNTYAGYIAGKPVSYTGEEIDNIQEVINQNDPTATDMESLINALIFGTSYELMYLDSEADIKYSQISPLNCFAIYSNSLEKKIKYFVRFYSVDDIDRSNKYVVEVYDNTSISYYQMIGMGGALELMYEERHYFADVPVSVFELNKEHESIFAQVITLNNAYNELQSCEVDDYSAWVDSYLLLSGCELESDDIKSMKENRVMILPDGGTANWLTKNASDTQINNMLENIKKNIYKISNCPDMTDDNFVAQSGTALQFKLVGFENTASAVIANMTKAIQRRLRLVCNILSLKAITEDWHNIKIQFTRNLPNNNLETAQVVNQLRGLVSDKTLLSIIPFVADPVAELDSMNEEKANNIAMYSFGNDTGDSDDGE